MELNTTLFRKEPRFDTRLCKVEKILELSGSDFVHLKENLLDEIKDEINKINDYEVAEISFYEIKSLSQ